MPMKGYGLVSENEADECYELGDFNAAGCEEWRRKNVSQSMSAPGEKK
jgi:hypothetical protein